MDPGGVVPHFDSWRQTRFIQGWWWKGVAMHVSPLGDFVTVLARRERRRYEKCQKGPTLQCKCLWKLMKPGRMETITESVGRIPCQLWACKCLIMWPHTPTSAPSFGTPLWFSCGWITQLTLYKQVRYHVVTGLVNYLVRASPRVVICDPAH
jgi:hypothetical protein